MKTAVNPKSLLQALEYTNEHYFSKPYSISPIVDRWFNQLAVVQLENGKVIHISGKTAAKYVDVTLDGIKISTKDLALVHRFHSQHTTHEKDKTALEERVKALELELKDQEPSEENKPKRKELLEHKASLEQYPLDKEKALKLYEGIVERGDPRQYFRTLG